MCAYRTGRRILLQQWPASWHSAAAFLVPAAAARISVAQLLAQVRRTPPASQKHLFLPGRIAFTPGCAGHPDPVRTEACFSLTRHAIAFPPRTPVFG